MPHWLLVQKTAFQMSSEAERLNTAVFHPSGEQDFNAQHLGTGLAWGVS